MNFNAKTVLLLVIMLSIFPIQVIAESNESENQRKDIFTDQLKIMVIYAYNHGYTHLSCTAIKETITSTFTETITKNPDLSSEDILEIEFVSETINRSCEIGKIDFDLKKYRLPKLLAAIDAIFKKENIEKKGKRKESI